MANDPPIAFFSYSREDSDFALRLAKDLRASGATVWLDQLDIRPGQLWDRAVENALAGCARMLVILSPASMASTNVMDEVSFALEEQKTVIPVLFRDCKIPFRLRRVQYIDCRVDYARGLEELLRTLAVETPAAVPPPAAEVRKVAEQEQQDRGAAEPAKAPTISNFSVEPSSIERGQSATLRWSVSDATDARIEPGLGVVQANGSRTVFPSSTTQYTLMASSPGGSREATASVNVAIPPPPPSDTAAEQKERERAATEARARAEPAKAPTISNFSVEPSSIERGQPATLRWSVSDATEVRIEPGLGVVQPNGSRTVSPSNTTQYKLTAPGPRESREATASVNVSVPTPPPPPPSDTTKEEERERAAGEARKEAEQEERRKGAAAPIEQGSSRTKYLVAGAVGAVALSLGVWYLATARNETPSRSVQPAPASREPGPVASAKPETLVPNRDAPKPSFDCQGLSVNRPVERLICQDAELAALDVSMVAAYRQALANLSESDKSALKAEHVDWLWKYSRACTALAPGGDITQRALRDCIQSYLTNHAREVRDWKPR